MTRASLLFIAMIGLSVVAVASPASSVDVATIDALAVTYRFQATNASDAGCHVTLKREPLLQSNVEALRPVDVAAACRAFSSLHGVTHWAATGGASVALFGGDPLTEASDFSPVQDATGVYLRGGFAGDTRIYELRPLTE